MLPFQKSSKKPEDRAKKRVRESSEETSSGRKGRGASVSSADEPKESKRERKEEKSKTGFDKGLKAEKIIGIIFTQTLLGIQREKSIVFIE